MKRLLGFIDMRISSRLRRLQNAHSKLAPPQRRHFTEDDWLEVFEEWGQQSHFDAEPDFPKALQSYRDVLSFVKARTDPPFDPPADFQPWHGIDPRTRTEAWRRTSPFDGLRAAWLWLAAIHSRVSDGVPPVTENEFQELAAWFAANTERLYEAARPSYSLDLGDGRTQSLANITCDLRYGPRHDYAGNVAEQVRQIRANYGDKLRELACD